MRKKLVIGNWKMNGRLETIAPLLQELCQCLPDPLKTVVAVIPPALYLPFVSDYLAKTSLLWGAQNVYPKECGAYTGELSAAMLSDYHCSYVLVGHSERRSLFKEDKKFIRDKFHHVKEHDMIPVLCVGETLQEREQGRTEQVLAEQLQSIVNDDKRAFRHCVIAYEPVWAIGTGQTASPSQVQEVHQILRVLVAEYNQEDAQYVPLLYGGSVTEKNASALFAMPDVDGGLIGGASLNARQFVEIVKCIN